MTNNIKYAFIICLTLCLGIFSGCSDEKEEVIESMKENQGQLIFSFSRINTYVIDDLLEIKRVKVNLKKDGKEISLKTLDLYGTTDSVATKPVILDEGKYMVYNYLVFDAKGDMIAEVYPEDNNTFTITRGETFNFACFVKIRVDISDSLMKNKLLGICTEIWGNDTVKWPKTWRDTNNEPLTWENIVWEEDYYGNPLYIVEFIFDEKFSGMKKLPIAVTQFVTLTGITISDLPEFEELCDEVVDLNINSLRIHNTSLKSLPENFGEMKYLNSLEITKSKLEEIPACVAKLQDVLVFDFSDNPIKEVSADIFTDLKNVTSFQLRNTEITSLPDNYFTSMPLISRYELDGNKNLSSLPNAIPDASSYMRGISINGCAFTEIPEIALKAKIKSLSMANNKVSSFTQNDLNASIELLDLSNNNITEFPALNSPALYELVLNNNNINVLPDLSGYPELLSISLSGNNIQNIPDNYFVNNKKLARIFLDNNQNLTSFSANPGFLMEEFVHEGETLTRPAKVNMISVNNCPSLVWTVPASWKAQNPYGPSKIVHVYSVNSPGVKY